MRVIGKKSHYHKLISSFLLMLTVPMLTVALIFFRAQNIVKEQILTTNRNALGLFFKHVDSVMESAVDTEMSIAFGNQYSEFSRQFLMKPERHGYYVWKLKEELTAYNNEKFQDVFVYYPGNDYVVSGKMSSLLEDYYDLCYGKQGNFWEEFASVANSPYKKPMLYSINGKGEDAFLCIAMRVGSFGNASRDYVVVIVLNQQYMRSMLQEMEENGEGVISFILNVDNEVVYSTGDNATWQETDLYQEMNDIYEGTIGGEKYVLVSQPSEQLEIVYSYAVPNKYFWSKLFDIYVIFLLGLFVSILLGGMVAYWQTNKLYRPFGTTIKKLQNQTVSKWDSRSNTEFEYIEMLFNKEAQEKHKLSNAVKQGKEIKKNNFILSLFSGEVMISQETEDIFAENGITLLSNCFCVIVLQAEDDGRMEKELLSFSVSNVLEEIFSQKHKGYVVPIADGKYGILVNLDNLCEGTAEITSLIDGGMSFFKVNFQLVFTAGISRVQQGLSGITEAYGEAVKALQYSYLLGIGKAIRYTQIQDREFRYPQNNSLQYILEDFMRENSCDKKLALQWVEKCMMKYLIDENASLDMVECFKFEIVNMLNRFIHQAGYWNQNWQENIMELVYRPTLDEFKEQFAELLLNAHIKQQEIGQETDICKRAKDYIEEHYGDSQLSLLMLSKEFGLTSSYFSKIFKDKYLFSIPDYINRIRIDRAKELLYNTADNIQDIATAVGFLESNTFIRAFKKMEGITPGRYRILTREEEKRE